MSDFNESINEFPQQKELLESMVDSFAEKMKAKLIGKSLQGWNGWQTCPIENLESGLKSHIEKGDMVDVANYALLLNARQSLTSAEEQNGDNIA